MPVPTTGKSQEGNLAERPELTTDEMWTAKEIEAILKIDKKTIYSYVQRGLMPYARIQSNVRFPKIAIRKWIEQQTFTPRTLKG